MASSMNKINVILNSLLINLIFNELLINLFFDWFNWLETTEIVKTGLMERWKDRDREEETGKVLEWLAPLKTIHDDILSCCATKNLTL